MTEVNAVPDGFGTVSVYLVVPKVTEAVEFYRRAFGAEPGMRMAGPDGDSTIHAELRIGTSTVMLTDENPQWNMQAPASLGGSPVSLHIYVDDADALFRRAVDAGCKVEYDISDAFWGDRYGKVKDPFGYTWGIATHREDLSAAEIAERQKEWFAQVAETGAAG